MSDLISRKDLIDYFVTNIGCVDEDGYVIDDMDERVNYWTEAFSGIQPVEILSAEEVAKEVSCTTILGFLEWFEKIKIISECGFAFIRKDRER